MSMQLMREALFALQEVERTGKYGWLQQSAVKHLKAATASADTKGEEQLRADFHVNALRWTSACAARYIEKANVDSQLALEWAVSAQETQDGIDVDGWDNPEDVADADMAEWTDDGDQL